MASKLREKLIKFCLFITLFVLCQSANSAANQCDVLAADRFDKKSVGEAVSWRNLNSKTAINACEKAVKQSPDNLTFQFQLGRAYIKDKQYKNALRWHKKAAEQGYAAAQQAYGAMLSSGKGVGKDREQAAKWYKKSAEQGYAPGQNNFGKILYKGKVVKKDRIQAAKWFKKSAEQGFATAQKNYGQILSTGKGVKKDVSEAVKWLTKSGEQGYAKAYKYLGKMYEKGIGLRVDYKTAVFWYKKANKIKKGIATKSIEKLHKEKGIPKRELSSTEKWKIRYLEDRPQLWARIKILKNHPKSICRVYGRKLDGALGSSKDEELFVWAAKEDHCLRWD